MFVIIENSNNMKKTEKDILQKDGLLYFNKTHRNFPSKSNIAQGYPAGFVNFNKIMAVVFAFLILLTIFYLAGSFQTT